MKYLILAMLLVAGSVSAEYYTEPGVVGLDTSQMKMRFCALAPEYRSSGAVRCITIDLKSVRELSEPCLHSAEGLFCENDPVTGI